MPIVLPAYYDANTGMYVRRHGGGRMGAAPEHTWVGGIDRRALAASSRRRDQAGSRRSRTPMVLHPHQCHVSSVIDIDIKP